MSEVPDSIDNHMAVVPEYISSAEIRKARKADRQTTAALFSELLSQLQRLEFTRGSKYYNQSSFSNGVKQRILGWPIRENPDVSLQVALLVNTETMIEPTNPEKRLLTMSSFCIDTVTGKLTQSPETYAERDMSVGSAWRPELGKPIGPFIKHAGDHQIISIEHWREVAVVVDRAPERELVLLAEETTRLSANKALEALRGVSLSDAPTSFVLDPFPGRTD